MLMIGDTCNTARGKARLCMWRKYAWHTLVVFLGRNKPLHYKDVPVGMRCVS